MTKTRIAQAVTVTLALCAFLLSPGSGLTDLVPDAVARWTLFGASMLSAVLPSLVSGTTAAVKRGGSALLLYGAVFAVAGCAELQRVKEPAKEIWYAAELLCKQDLAAIPQVQAIFGAVQLINEVCHDVEVARPYVEVILREQRERGIDPLFRARQNALAVLRSRLATGVGSQ
jgi:hypothetical protein